jgi:predicted DNA-binding protein (MmcQ/YjbR family)
MREAGGDPLASRIRIPVGRPELSVGLGSVGPRPRGGGVVDYAEVPDEVVGRLREVCLALPEAYEEQAWVGTRWRVRGRTFAHVLAVDGESPLAYARAARTAGMPGPVTMVTFRAPPEEVDALSRAGPPYFHAQWGRDVVGMVLDGEVDWTEVAELMTESYCVLAPKKLIRLVRRPARLN